MYACVLTSLSVYQLSSAYTVSWVVMAVPVYLARTAGNCSTAEIETYILQGFNAVLPKPFDLNALATCLTVHCARRATAAPGGPHRAASVELRVEP